MKAYVRADGIKPEDIAEILAIDDCERILLFPYYLVDDKTIYYELTLDIDIVKALYNREYVYGTYWIYCAFAYLGSRFLTALTIKANSRIS
ncbi:hypothetical protein AGMMS49975_08380 [Clostridia bacterium]|nr:hypothetical protein AGMMS49975_08380 [Clostridia bacterium]